MSDFRERVHEVMHGFEISTETLKRVSDILLDEFNKGLSKDKSSSVKMLPSFVRDIPNGQEEGKFLALDLGGSTFRILFIELEGRNFKTTHEVFELTESTMTGPGKALFDSIANCLAEFVTKYKLDREVLPLGFTFSFPCVQKGLTEAFLIRWTKGFRCPGVEGKNVVQLLRDAISRRGDVNIDIIAVVNDTTGTLMSCAHRNENCRVGVIIGTGTNACYMENLENVEKWKEDTEEPRQVIINCEWGAFGDNGCIDFLRTPFDQEVDEASINPGEQLFEKMISGMYMGELVRRIIIKLANEGEFNNGIVTEKLSEEYAFKTKYLSFIEHDVRGEQATEEILMKMGIKEPSEKDCSIAQLVCCLVSTRAAHLVSAGVATILNKRKQNFTTIGVDGSVYRYHPLFKSKMEDKIKELVDPKYEFELMLSEDGSGRGAALVAAVAKRLNELNE